MDKMTVSRAVRPLVDRRLVARQPNEGDGRSHLLQLTDTGRVLYSAVVPTARQLETEMLRQFSKGEITKLMASLQRLEKAAARLTGNGETARR
jgi:DNA-binding MarR family transcriptional regulator